MDRWIGSPLYHRSVSLKSQPFRSFPDDAIPARPRLQRSLTEQKQLGTPHRRRPPDHHRAQRPVGPKSFRHTPDIRLFDPPCERALADHRHATRRRHRRACKKTRSKNEPVAGAKRMAGWRRLLKEDAVCQSCALQATERSPADRFSEWSLFQGQHQSVFS